MTSREALDDRATAGVGRDRRRRRGRRRVRVRLRELRRARHRRRDGRDAAPRHGRRPRAASWRGLSPTQGIEVLVRPSLRAAASVAGDGARGRRSRGPDGRARRSRREQVLVAVGRAPLLGRPRARGARACGPSGLRRRRRRHADERRGRLRDRRPRRPAAPGARRVGAGRDRGRDDGRASRHASGGLDPTRVPMCVYCQPEVAAVGLTEAEARARGGDVAGRASSRSARSARRWRPGTSTAS